MAREGLVVDRGVFGELVGDRCIPAQWLCNALETALLVMRGDERATAAHMARFWGHKQFRILRLVTQSDCSAPLIADVDPLATAGPIMLDRIMARENSFHAILTEAILSYFYAQRTGRLPPALQEPIVDRRGALSYRNATLGLIPVTGNLDEVDRFCHAIEHSSVMSAVETWAFSTVHYDSSITTDFSLPRSLLLRGAAGNVVQELEKCNDAYFYYLVRAAIPLLLQRDPTLGLRGSHVRSAIANRMERCAERGITREANILLSHWPAAA
ncbi:hypothetical protein CRH09_09645 [Nocardia terpenica]|uniref:Uncharacterized protein n=1 Tax=Nocardia terpenica TaxID=455432 RepID=A0A291RGK6_9NOCA|nr:hypothetical protein CRH09_09645 [Nocardia terpenica]